MMKVLKQFEFTAKSRGTKYDWAKLLDGGIYQLEEGKDFTCKPATFAMIARKHAKLAGLAVRVQQVDGGLVIQADKKAAK